SFSAEDLCSYIACSNEAWTRGKTMPEGECYEKMEDLPDGDVCYIKKEGCDEQIDKSRKCAEMGYTETSDLSKDGYDCDACEIDGEQYPYWKCTEKKCPGATVSQCEESDDGEKCVKCYKATKVGDVQCYSQVNVDPACTSGSRTLDEATCTAQGKERRVVGGSQCGGSCYECVKPCTDCKCDITAAECEANNMFLDTTHCRCICANNSQCYNKADSTCGDRWTACKEYVSGVYSYCMGASQAGKKEYDEGYCNRKLKEQMATCDNYLNYECPKCSNGGCTHDATEPKWCSRLGDFSGYYPGACPRSY
ncbi:MAG: hypothetical protein J6Y91_04120, partial [Alphaproteobacteria bacterium]|nr:hypothetical protein [Alphaproteobacteria bacterium]